jgi:hypothetical protein
LNNQPIRVILWALTKVTLCGVLLHARAGEDGASRLKSMRIPTKKEIDLDLIVHTPCVIGYETTGSIARSMSTMLRFTEKNVDKIVIDISNKPVDNIPHKTQI